MATKTCDTKVDGLATQVEDLKECIDQKTGDINKKLGELSERYAVPEVRNYLIEAKYKVKFSQGDIDLMISERKKLGELVSLLWLNKMDVID